MQNLSTILSHRAIVRAWRLYMAESFYCINSILQLLRLLLYIVSKLSLVFCTCSYGYPGYFPVYSTVKILIKSICHKTNMTPWMINKQSVLQRLAMQLHFPSAWGVGRVSVSLMSEIRKLPNEEICLTNDVISGKATRLICKEEPSNPSITFPGMWRRSCLCQPAGKEDAVQRQQWGLPAWSLHPKPSCRHPHTSTGWHSTLEMPWDPGSPSTAALGLQTLTYPCYLLFHLQWRAKGISVTFTVRFC